ncbi:exodeoxyribonuclease V subunit beta [Pseudoduganella sp. DS3]|uniref:RecBCD enzyme subunit RecB n=1 Tax=Pseudoduganella guangdongensis TaxID=2692179 RepID=A0A6N9HJN2_9BURK|nr:exodeoxyribonuclease V subunit beta [Pseudoduganella guangdongensis]MYN03363.1 exodeoxyribonuclease V subunit beta [Pseudoduganella guangdongensis]
MSIALNPLDFPLHGSRLIEASAGTGKTWTIAALYVRLVLGHGRENAFARPLMPSEILVMTFTRAATRELSNRVRERLVEAAAYFRAEGGHEPDSYLDALLEELPDAGARLQAAHRLQLAAETMDEAAIFTIDAWCQRMLREHAFDSGNLFDEELLSDEGALYEDAAHDYWRQQVYPLGEDALQVLLSACRDVEALKRSVRELARRPDAAACAGPSAMETLGAMIARVRREQMSALAALKDGWAERADRMEGWIAAQREDNPKCFNGTKLRADSVVKWFAALRDWASDPAQHAPDMNDTPWFRLTPAGMVDACAKNFVPEIPDDFEAIAPLRRALDAIEPLRHHVLRHAAATIAARMQALKAQQRQFGFADMLERLRGALEGGNGAALRQRIISQYPVAMVDEFQDTAPSQYRIFNLLYRVADNARELGLFLIGDPKQSIYGFRGADIHSYLDARRATAGRHYQLGTNFRSTAQVVAAVNQVFLHAEGVAGQGGFARGAFRFRTGEGNPLPFDAVGARGREERLVGPDGDIQALTAGCTLEQLGADAYREYFAEQCAEHIACLLNDEATGFQSPAGFKRLQPADIAILVRDRREAAAVRKALQRRVVPSVYLSDKDSVLSSEEAADMLRWLSAVANPLDGQLARTAFATRSANLPLAELAQFSADELAWERRVEQLKEWHVVWQRQGVLAMLRRFIHDLGLPAQLLARPGGERSLTNMLHLAELLQQASRQLEGEQALIRWLAEQIEDETDGGDERVLRLESDAELVKVVTVHKSKGLEYPLVYLPFAVSVRKVDKRNRIFFEYTDASGARRIDMQLSDAGQEAAEAARLEEDLRLLYVALTRARHFLWLGVAALPARKKDENTLHESALGYLLTGGEALPAGQLLETWQRLRGACDAIAVATLAPSVPVTRLARAVQRPPLEAPLAYHGDFERDWSVGSFSSLARRSGEALPAPMRAAQETLMEGEDAASSLRIEDAVWHRFPRGSMPGNFLHEQLEALAREGFAAIHQEHYAERAARQIKRSGWGNREAETLEWLRVIASTALPPLGSALDGITRLLPEMEFWFPSERLDTAQLDRLCRQHLLEGIARPALPQRELHGMLKGFCDLVFEHDGRYWVLDYKSNALGGGDAAYHKAALSHGMAAHRYDVQGAIYMLALHRLLRTRLGQAYDPATQLGGAIFYFLRGVGNAQTRGCYVLPPEAQLLDGLDGLCT